MQKYAQSMEKFVRNGTNVIKKNSKQTKKNKNKKSKQIKKYKKEKKKNQKQKQKQNKTSPPPKKTQSKTKQKKPQQCHIVFTEIFKCFFFSLRENIWYSYSILHSIMIYHGTDCQPGTVSSNDDLTC